MWCPTDRHRAVEAERLRRREVRVQAVSIDLSISTSMCVCGKQSSADLARYGRAGRAANSPSVLHETPRLTVSILMSQQLALAVVTDDEQLAALSPRMRMHDVTTIQEVFAFPVAADRPTSGRSTALAAGCSQNTSSDHPVICQHIRK